MASGTRGLFLQIGGNTDNLAVAAKAGKSILAQLGTDAVASIDDIQDAFRKMGGGAVEESARSIQQTYSRAFSAIRANANAVLDAPNASAALGIVNVTAATNAAEAAERQAAGLRLVADASARASAAQGDNNLALRTFATASAAAAVGAEEQAAALRSQAAALGLVHGELIASGEASEVVVAGHNRMSTSGLILEQVARSIGDSFAAGMPPAQIFAEQLGRVGEAAALVASGVEGGGKLGAIAGFLTGPWGIALTLGASLLSPLIKDLIDTGHAADDAKKAEEEYAKAQGDLGDAIDKANGKLVERNRLLTTISLQEQRPQINSAQAEAKSFSDQAFAAARARADSANFGSVADQASAAIAISHGADPAIFKDPAVQKAIDSANGNVIKLRDNLDALAKQATGKTKAGLEQLADSVNHFAGLSAAASQKADQLRGTASAVGSALAGKPVLTTESVQRSVEDKNANTPLDKAKQALRDIEAQKTDLDKMPYSPAQQAAVKKWGEELDAATAKVKQLEAAQKDAREGRQVGRQINLQQAEDIVHSVGGTVTSLYRSTAQQQVLYDRYRAGTGPLAAKPGTSLHESGQALDVAKTAGVSLASLKKAFEDAGVHLTEALDEGNHYHVGFGRKGVDPTVAAHRQEVRAANDDRGYQGQVRSADDDIDRANADLANTTEARSRAALDRLRSDLGARDAALQDEVTAGKLTQAEADILKVKLGSAEYEQEQLQQRKDLGEYIQRQAEQAQQQLAGDVAFLQLQSVLATTTAQRRDIALKLLAKDEESERIAQNAIIAYPNSTPDQVADARTRLAQVDAEHPLKERQVNQENASPLDAYKLQLQKSVGDTNEALQGVGVDTFKGLEDSFVGVISGTETIAGAFKKMASSIISDIARIVVERAILGSLNLSGGAGGSGGGIGGFFSHILGHADGGHITGPGTGRSDSIVARLSNGEFVVNAAATARHLPLLHALNDNSLPAFADGGVVGSIPQMRDLSPSEMREVASGSGRAGAAGANHFHLEGAVVTQDLVDQMNAIGARAADEGANRGFQRTQEHYARQQRYAYPGS